MDQLPDEVFGLIFPYLGGIDFLNFRRTCWRHLTIVDDVELHLKPSIWRRFVFSDFHPSCVESVSPRVYRLCDRRAWKELYILLFLGAALPSKQGLEVRVDRSLSYLDTEDIKFFKNNLFLLNNQSEVKVLKVTGDGIYVNNSSAGDYWEGDEERYQTQRVHRRRAPDFGNRPTMGIPCVQYLASKSPKQQDVILTTSTDSLKEMREKLGESLRVESVSEILEGCTVKLLRCWHGYCIGYCVEGPPRSYSLKLWKWRDAKLTLVEELGLPRRDCEWLKDIAPKCVWGPIDPLMALEGADMRRESTITSLDFNNFALVVVVTSSYRDQFTEKTDICFHQYDDTTGFKGSWVKASSICPNPVKVKLMGTLLFAMSGTGELWVCPLAVGHHGKLRILDHSRLVTFAVTDQAVNIVDFDVLGTNLVAVSKTHVFLSSFQDMSFNSIQKNMRQVTTLETHGHVTRISFTYLGVSRGLSVAVLERDLSLDRPYVRSPIHLVTIT